MSFKLAWLVNAALFLMEGKPCHALDTLSQSILSSLSFKLKRHQVKVYSIHKLDIHIFENTDT